MLLYNCRMSNGESYAGPQGVYLPESLSLEQVQQGSQIACELTRTLPGSEGYSPNDIYSMRFKTGNPQAFEAALRAIEQQLADRGVIQFDEFDRNDPDNPLNPSYPRCYILERRLMADAVQDTYASGFLDTAAELVHMPERVEAYARDEWRPSTLYIAGAAADTLYSHAQLRAREAVAKRNDPAELERYQALDRLTVMLSYAGDIHGPDEYAGSVSAAIRERQGFRTSMVSTAGHLLEHIYVALEDLASQQPDKVPDSIPAGLVQHVVARINDTDKRKQQRDLFGLACDLTLASISPYAHINMSLKLGQLVEWVSVTKQGMQTVAVQTHPVALGRAATQIVWAFPRIEPGEEIPPRHILSARKLPDPQPSTLCPGRMPFIEPTVPNHFHTLFGEDVPKRFDRSPADEAVYMAVQIMRAYTLYRFDRDPESSIFKLIHIPD